MDQRSKQCLANFRRRSADRLAEMGDEKSEQQLQTGRAAADEAGHVTDGQNVSVDRSENRIDAYRARHFNAHRKHVK